MKAPAHWHSHNLTSALLTPLSWLYRLAATMDRRITEVKHAPLPVISIGNLTAGGAGKTPTTLALIPMLQALGHTPHILTRGYGGDSLQAHRVTASDDYHRVGDEALLLARLAPTWVGRDRLASAHAAANAGATVLVCDDALQHHALYKDISLLVIDGGFGFGNGKCLPAGPLRETLASARSRIDAAIIIGDDVQQLAPELTCPVFTAKLVPDAAALTHPRYLAFAGIGRPQKFFDSLTKLGATLVATRSFPDHYPYSEHDLKTLAAEAAQHQATLITTEKDAVKLPPNWRTSIAVLPITLTLDTQETFTHWLKSRLAQRPS